MTSPGHAARERGATTAEYVGVLVFVSLLVVALIAFATPLGARVGTVAGRAYCTIAKTVGGAAPRQPPPTTSPPSA